MSERVDYKVLDALFSTDDVYNELTKSDKEKSFFLVNRRMSIGFPIQAFKLSQMNINSEYAIDCWRLIAKKFKYKPKWLYTKTETVKSEKIKYSKDSKEYYMVINQISEKDFDNAFRFAPNEMTEYLYKLDKHLKNLQKVKGND